ncbi:hypothetical protein SUGI_0676790 [Cryptomeria japonica]|nr:hypothetical protein SUGI_0676790 [Cryptomeria japonica]
MTLTWKVQRKPGRRKFMTILMIKLINGNLYLHPYLFAEDYFGGKRNCKKVFRIVKIIWICTSGVVYFSEPIAALMSYYWKP